MFWTNIPRFPYHLNFVHFWITVLKMHFFKFCGATSLYIFIYAYIHENDVRKFIILRRFVCRSYVTLGKIINQMQPKLDKCLPCYIQFLMETWKQIRLDQSAKTKNQSWQNYKNQVWEKMKYFPISYNLCPNWNIPIHSFYAKYLCGSLFSYSIHVMNCSSSFICWFTDNRPNTE